MGTTQYYKLRPSAVCERTQINCWSTTTVIYTLIGNTYIQFKNILNFLFQIELDTFG